MGFIAIFRDGLLHYLLLCAVSIAMGLGILRLVRLDLPTQMALAFAPVLATACWAVVLGVGVTLRAPVRYLAAPLWVLTIGLAIYGLSWVLAWARAGLGVAPQNSLGFVATGIERSVALQRSHARRMLSQGWLIATCVVLPIAVMFPYFVTGLTNHPRSIFPDGWSYVAYGQYLWSNSRGTEGGLAPLYQFGSHLSYTRFIASSLLGFLSPLFSAGDTQMASGLFLAWGLFTFASSCAFFSLAQGLSASRLLAYLVLTVFSGWVCNMLWANNYDNALALIYFPALIGSIAWLSPRSWPWRFVLGFLAAGLLYSYPELALFILGGVLLVAIDRCWPERREMRSWLLTAACALGVALALAAPYIPEMYAFVRSQAAIGLRPSRRPGEGLFAGLLQLRYQPAALWGLGGEYGVETWLPIRNALGLLLSAVAMLGLTRLVKQRRIGFAATIVLLIMAGGFFILVQQYSYGAYKMILLAWWAICYTLVLGLDGLQRFRAGVLRYAAIGLSALTILLTLTFNHYGIEAPNAIKSKYERMEMSEFRQLQQLKQIAGGAGLLVMVDDWLANEWAVYYLRDMPIYLTEYRMYMGQPHVIPVMRRAQAVAPQQARYVLTDMAFDTAINTEQHWQMVWSGGPYRLWRPKDTEWAIVSNITNPNGVEQLDGERFFWVGKGATVIQVLAGHAGVLQLSANMLLGPGLPERPDRKIQITVNDTISETMTVQNGYQVFAVPATVGENTITITPLDKPSVAKTNGNDTRSLLLGVKGLAAALRPESIHGVGHITLRGIENPNGLERVDGQQFLWIGQGTTVLHILSDRAGKVQFSAELTIGPSLPGKAERKLHIATDRGYQTEATVGQGAYMFSVPVALGATDVLIKSLDTPGPMSAAQGDRRPLLLGVKGLQMWFQEQ